MSAVDDNRNTSFETLLKPHLDRLYRMAFRLTGNKPEAEDLFQDVLTKVFPRLDDLIEVEAPGPWLCRIMYNHFIDNRRRFARQRLVTVSEDQLPGDGIESVAGELSPERDAMQEDKLIQLESALGKLSDEHRLVCPSSNKWNRRRVYLKESFVPHFQFTRRIADSATDASRWSFS
jgi:RNA polymerase sigma factor (sigma-70 family)